MHQKWFVEEREGTVRKGSGRKRRQEVDQGEITGDDSFRFSYEDERPRLSACVSIDIGGTYHGFEEGAKSLKFSESDSRRIEKKGDG